ncbi:MAG TPA: hypothetical protein VG709_02355 [Actinomycetota bacterium]|nr:hypothetical protein [Actinomycetota bacterium]
MTKETAVVVALSLLGAAGLLASIVAAVLLWRDVARGDARAAEPATPDHEEEP